MRRTGSARCVAFLVAFKVGDIEVRPYLHIPTAHRQSQTVPASQTDPSPTVIHPELRPPAQSFSSPRRPAPAPAIVALIAAWLGLLDLLAAVIFIFLPGSKNAVAELQHARPYSMKDRFLPFPVYG